MMSALDRIQQLWRRLMADLTPETTAIALHWPGDGPTARADQTFMLRGVLRGEALHRVLDALLEEHTIRSSGSDATLTEVTVFWCLPDGSWEMDELESHLYA